MQDQRGDADGWQDVADVDVEIHAEILVACARTGAEAEDTFERPGFRFCGIRVRNPEAKGMLLDSAGRIDRTPDRLVDYLLLFTPRG